MAKRKKAMHAETRHAPAKSKKEKQIVTVVESFVDRVQVHLEEILQRADVIIEFPKANAARAAEYVELNDRSEVYVAEEGSEDFYHGELIFDHGHSYEIDLFRNQTDKFSFHDYENLRKMIVMKRG